MKEVHHAGHQTLDLQADYNKEKGKPNKSLEILVLTLQSIVLDTAYKNYTNGAQYKHHVVIWGLLTFYLKAFFWAWDIVFPVSAKHTYV